VNFVNLEDAVLARNELNGQEINGSPIKIGFAKVPSKAEPITVQQALSNPSVLSGLATAAIDRLSTLGAWKEQESSNAGIGS
jgi:RNA recognition motif-containing protein